MTRVAYHKHIFLCGLHRSGTTPLFHILRQHPQISGFRDTGVPEDEGQHLQNIYPPAKAFGGPGRFGFAPAAHLTETSELLTPQNKRMLVEQWSRHWNLDREFLLEKSPPNLIRTRFLQACFRDSYFIVILRHPVAVSLATIKWSKTRLESLVEHWLHCHELFESDRSHLQHVVTIRYEDLIRDTPSTLEELGRFLPLNSEFTAGLDPAGNERYFLAWHAYTERGAGRATFRDLVDKYEDRVRRFGYSLEIPSSLRPSPFLTHPLTSRTQSSPS